MVRQALLPGADSPPRFGVDIFSVANASDSTTYIPHGPGRSAGPNGPVVSYFAALNAVQIGAWYPAKETDLHRSMRFGNPACPRQTLQFTRAIKSLILIPFPSNQPSKASSLRSPHVSIPVALLF